MKILLDTSVFLKWTNGESLFKRATSMLHKSERYISVITPWEIALKASRYPDSKLPPSSRLAHAVEALGATFLQITLSHSSLIYRLPMHHCDPFDRMLIAQAITEQMMIITNDERFPLYKRAGLQVLWD